MKKLHYPSRSPITKLSTPKLPYAGPGPHVPEAVADAALKVGAEVEVGQPAGLAHHRPVQSQARLAGSHVVVFNFGFTSVMNVMKNFDPCGQRTAYILFYTQYKIVMLLNTIFFK